MATWDRYTGLTTGLELRSRTGAIFEPRSYCDDPDIGPVGVYITKGPVCKLKLTPTVQFANVNIAWDISQSRSSTGTIDSFDITWGGTTDIGDLASQDWASDPKTGNVQYTTPGTYTVQAYVTDLLNEQSKVVKITVTIVEFVGLQRCYIGTTDGGLYILVPGGSPTQANTGLSGSHLNFRSVRLHPAYKDLPVGQHHLWAATGGGLAASADGAANWSTLDAADWGTPDNAAADDPAPASVLLDQIDLCFDPQDPSRIYVLRTQTTPRRAWLYWADDYGATWSNEQMGVLA